MSRYKVLARSFHYGRLVEPGMIIELEPYQAGAHHELIPDEPVTEPAPTEERVEPKRRRRN